MARISEAQSQTPDAMLAQSDRRVAELAEKAKTPSHDEITEVFDAGTRATACDVVRTSAESALKTLDIKNLFAQAQELPRGGFSGPPPEAEEGSPDKYKPQVYYQPIRQHGVKAALKEKFGGGAYTEECLVYIRLNNSETNPFNPEDNTVVVAHVRQVNGVPQFDYDNALFNVMNESDFNRSVASGKDLTSKWLRGERTSQEYRDDFKSLWGGGAGRIFESLDDYWDRRDRKPTRRADMIRRGISEANKGELLERLKGTYAEKLQAERTKQGEIHGRVKQELLVAERERIDSIKQVNELLAQLKAFGHLTDVELKAKATRLLGALGVTGVKPEALVEGMKTPQERGMDKDVARAKAEGAAAGKREAETRLNPQLREEQRRTATEKQRADAEKARAETEKAARLEVEKRLDKERADNAAALKAAFDEMTKAREQLATTQQMLEQQAKNTEKMVGDLHATVDEEIKRREVAEEKLEAERVGAEKRLQQEKDARAADMADMLKRFDDIEGMLEEMRNGRSGGAVGPMPESAPEVTEVEKTA